MSTIPVWLVLMLAGAPTCSAPAICKCGMPPVEDAYASSDAVFTGVVVAVGEPYAMDTATVPPPPPREDPSVPGTIVVPVPHLEWVQPVTVRVTHGWKVPAGDTITFLNRYFCGVLLVRGREYVVYARRGPGHALATSRCDGTRPLGEARADVAVLDRLAAPPRP